MSYSVAFESMNQRVLCIFFFYHGMYAYTAECTGFRVQTRSDFVAGSCAHNDELGYWGFFSMCLLCVHPLLKTQPRT